MLDYVELQIALAAYLGYLHAEADTREQHETDRLGITPAEREEQLWGRIVEARNARLGVAR